MTFFRSCLFSSVLLFTGLACTDSPDRQPGTQPPSPADSSVTLTDNYVNPYASIDISPMDMSYYPVDYTKLKMAKAIGTPPLARVIYSRPHLQRRRLFSQILRYGEIWRLGANEATELELFSDAMIQDKKIRKGRYTLYCIPDSLDWTIIMNTNLDTWGLQPDPSKDLARFVIPVRQTETRLEYFTMKFEKTSKGADLIMAWDDTEARLPFRFE